MDNDSEAMAAQLDNPNPVLHFTSAVNSSADLPVDESDKNCNSGAYVLVSELRGSLCHDYPTIPNVGGQGWQPWRCPTGADETCERDNALSAFMAGHSDDTSSAYEDVTAHEVFERVRNLNDPEHPYSLEQLGVLKVSDISVDNTSNTVTVFFTPTIPHCSQATLIGLMIRVKLTRCLPSRFKVDVMISQGSHNTEEAVNKQLTDKERVAAALENPALRSIIHQGIANTDLWESLYGLI
eukprot:GHVQ01004572.1.p1 GENE.GHVQ01004572.1~~GHVQ01004572.1.p1  ORF type:complete len:239 (+),score=24.85 GHVQ01004572.1:147-863(+)